MDVHLIYLDSVDNRLVKPYIGSSFMGYSDAFSNLASIKETVEGLNNYVRVSSVRPNIN